MKNSKEWKPSKYVYRRGILRSSKREEEIGVYSRLTGDLIAEFYDANCKQYVRGSVLDLGCGKVPLYGTYRNYATNCTCVDWASTLHRSDHVDYFMDLNKKLSFPDGSFDTIILSDVLEHIRRPEFLLSEMFRILTPGGTALINVPFFYWLHEVPYDYYRYTEFALRGMLEEKGFSIAKLEAYGGAPEVIADLFSKLTCKHRFLGRLVAVSLQGAAWQLRKTQTGKKISRISARYLPLGYAVVAAKRQV